MNKKHFFVKILNFVTAGYAVKRRALTADVMGNATIYGMKDIRAFGGIPSTAFRIDMAKVLGNKNKNPFLNFFSNQINDVLAISGGGAYGAYAAGILNGWSKAGTRPPFKIVTGVSAGAIAAPFAFLGSMYDDQLKEFFTSYSTRDLFHRVHLFRNSFSSAAPLRKIFDKYYNTGFLKAVAMEYEAGRRLYVGTTNLDAQRLVIWDMGKIASYGDEKALKLFRDIILASASMPIACPPVYFPVEIEGKIYNEMHVDGGVTKQVFFLYDVLKGIEKVAKENGHDISKGQYKIYVIRNGYAGSVWQEVSDELVDIAERAMDTMINAQSIGDIYQLYTFTKLSKGDFNLAYIPSNHLFTPKETFDKKEMRALFDLGFNEARKGYKWKKIPPGME